MPKSTLGVAEIAAKSPDRVGDRRSARSTRRPTTSAASAVSGMQALSLYYQHRRIAEGVAGVPREAQARLSVEDRLQQPRARTLPQAAVDRHALAATAAPTPPRSRAARRAGARSDARPDPDPCGAPVPPPRLRGDDVAPDRRRRRHQGRQHLLPLRLEGRDPRRGARCRHRRGDERGAANASPRCRPTPATATRSPRRSTATCTACCTTATSRRPTSASTARSRRPRRPGTASCGAPTRRYWDDLLQAALDAGELRDDTNLAVIRLYLIGALNWTVEWYNPNRGSFKLVLVADHRDRLRRHRGTGKGRADDRQRPSRRHGMTSSKPTPPRRCCECRAIERRFGGLVALNGVDLHIERGEIFGLVGPNGSGKTTLINAITGFYPPQKGAIVLNGRDITGMAPHRVARARRRAHVPEPRAVPRHDGARQHPARPPRPHAAERRCATLFYCWSGPRATRSSTARWSRRSSTSCSSQDVRDEPVDVDPARPAEAGRAGARAGRRAAAS